MLFNSIEFLIFLTVVFTIYWSIQRLKLSYQNAFLLVVSYIFYGWWDYRFLSLIFISSFIDYTISRLIEKEERQKTRKLLLIISIFTSLGILCFFKYFNFFIDSFENILTFLGFQSNIYSLNVILPVGISFYTFQTMSYTIDVYKRKINASNDIIAFFAYVSFFPQLVAGPIERATNLLPQFYVKREFNTEKSIDGLRQILWGLFKKVVIADNLAEYVNTVYTSYSELGGINLLLGTFFFALQIYCDFSGYSEIAVGTAKLFGFIIMRNFAYPFFSRDVTEFWRRWHISLSTWFRDYVYIPLGGNRVSKLRHIFNLVITFTISGLWHGANWTYIFWGFLNGLYFIPRILLGRYRKYDEIIGNNSTLPSLLEFFNVVITFNLILFAWIFFRAESMSHAILFIKQIFTNFKYSYLPTMKMEVKLLLSFSIIIIEWFQRREKHALTIGNLHVTLRWLIYLVIVSLIVLIGKMGKIDFIYFQF